MRLSNLLKQKPSMKDTNAEGPRINMSERSLSDWLSDAGNTLDDRGLEYGDPRHNLYRIFRIARILGIQLRDPADVAMLFIATKLSRMVESPEREDSYLDLIGYAAILGRCRFSTPEDWDDVESDSQY
jgi:hypothetical protein